MMSAKAHKKYDAIIVGSGPNGIAAAITLAQNGYRVKIVEGHHEIGGGTRTNDLGMPGYLHDVCSAAHPMAFVSPFFKQFNWKKMGVEWVNPPISYAHPLEGNNGSFVVPDLKETVSNLPKVDQKAWFEIFNPLLKNFDRLFPLILGPLKLSKDLNLLPAFGIKALQPACFFIQKNFKSREVQSLFSGLCAHSINPLNHWATTAVGLVLGVAAHKVGWPIAVGGSHQITMKMADYFSRLGGEIETNLWVNNIDSIKDQAKAVLLDISPNQLLTIAEEHLPSIYKKRIQQFEYGSGIFKVDFALDRPVPWTFKAARNAGTLHLGGSFKAIMKSEQETYQGKVPKDPYVLVSQQSIFDKSRAPQNKHTLWAYLHAPAGSDEDLTTLIINQIERFAPGFEESILAKHSMHSKNYESYNPNFVGGDINSGRQKLTQLFSRPLLQFDPYKTAMKGVFLCSSSTPPGGGVHGMCGYHAAQSALNYLKTNY